MLKKRPSPPFKEFTCHYGHSFIQQVFTEDFLCIRHSSGLLTYKQSRPRSLSQWNLHYSGNCNRRDFKWSSNCPGGGKHFFGYTYIQSRSNPRLSPWEQEGRRNILKSTEQKGRRLQDIQKKSKLLWKMDICSCIFKVSFCQSGFNQ